MTPDKRVEEIVQDYHDNFPKCPQSLIGSILRQEDVDEFNRAIERGEIWLRTTLTQYHQDLMSEREEMLSALESMYGQYCSDGHSFMSAGEEASYVLEKYTSMKLDETGRVMKLSK